MGHRRAARADRRLPRPLRQGASRPAQAMACTPRDEAPRVCRARASGLLPERASRAVAIGALFGRPRGFQRAALHDADRQLYAEDRAGAPAALAAAARCEGLCRPPFVAPDGLHVTNPSTPPPRSRPRIPLSDCESFYSQSLSRPRLCPAVRRWSTSHASGRSWSARLGKSSVCPWRRSRCSRGPSR